MIEHFINLNHKYNYTSSTCFYMYTPLELRHCFTSWKIFFQHHKPDGPVLVSVSHTLLVCHPQPRSQDLHPSLLTALCLHKTVSPANKLSGFPSVVLYTFSSALSTPGSSGYVSMSAPLLSFFWGGVK